MIFNRKSILTLLLAAVLTLSLAACGGNGNTTASSEQTQATEATQGTTPEETEPAPTGAFKAGFGRADITPQLSVPMEGYGNTEGRLSNGYLDPLYATCIALQDENGETALLYCIDMLGIKLTETNSIRNTVSEALGIKKELIHINCSHSHSAPCLLSTGTNMTTYLVFFYGQMLKAAQDAVADLKDCTASISSGEVSGLNFTRHVKLSDGSYAGPNCGDFSAGTIVGYETEADHSARFLRFEREGAKDILLCNFQVHATRTGGIKLLDISADVPGQLRNSIEAGEDVYCAYMQGGAGNINPTSYITKDTLTEDYKEWGEQFYKQVKTALQDKTPVELGPIKTTGLVTFTGNVNHTQDKLLNEAMKIRTEFYTTGDRGKCIQMGKPFGIHSCYHAENIITKAGLGPTRDMEIAAMSFGDVGVFMAPYEMFDGNAKFVRDNSPFDLTLCMCYCNDYQSYLAADYSYDNTCYEADRCYWEKGTAEILAQRFADMLTELKNAPAPTEKVELEGKEAENVLDGLTWDGNLYYNYTRTFYSGKEVKDRPRKDGVYTVPMIAANGTMTSVQIKGKPLMVQVDKNDVVCLWKDKNGEIKAATSPEEAGLNIVRNQYIVSIKDKEVAMNSAHGLNGVASTLTLPATGYALALVPENTATSTQKASRLLSKDCLTVVTDKTGALKALFIVGREGVEGENLARSANVSTTYDAISNATSDNIAPIGRIIDGDSRTDYTTSCQYRWNEDGCILFDLGSACELSEWRMYNYEWPYQWCINQAWTFYGSLDGKEFTKIGEGSIDCTNFTSESVQYATNIKYGAPDKGELTGKYRYVKLVIDEVFVGAGDNTRGEGESPNGGQNKDVRMYEVEIWGTPGENSAYNLATSAKVTTSYDQNGTYPLTSLTDGRNACVAAEQCLLNWKADSNVTLDFGQICDLTEYRIYNYDWPMQYGGMKAWSVYVSEDGINFTKVGEDHMNVESLQGGAVAYTTGVRSGKPDGGKLEGVKARYFRLVCDEAITGSNSNVPQIRIYELEVFGTPAEGGNSDMITNIAPDAKVTSTYKIIKSDGYFASLINDGSEANGLNACAGWNFSEGGEILFELAKESSVSGYKLVNMGEPEVYGGVKDWQVLVSADGSNWTEIDNGKGLSAGSAEKMLDTPVTAKFVKLIVLDSHCYTNLADTVADKRVIRIAEFEIFGK